MEQLERNLNYKNWDELGVKVLDASKQELFLAMRYLFEPLNMLEYQPERQIPYMATDGKKLYYNPMLMCGRYRDNPVKVNRGFLHIIMHCIFRNLYSWEGRDREVWDLACDIMAEYLIDSIELSCVMLPENAERERIYKRIAGTAKIMSAANIYYELKKFSEGELLKLQASELFTVDDHSLWYDNKNDDDKDEDKDNDSTKEDDEQKWQNAAKKMEAAIGLFGNGRGDSKGNLKRTLAAKNRNRISYRDFLRKFAVIRENIKIDMDSFDYGFYNYGLTIYKNMPLIEELEYVQETGIEDFAIVLDTSGSCAYELLQKFLDTTFEILTSTDIFFEKMNLHIIQCDNEVQQDTVLHCKAEIEEFRNNFEIRGFGGTDFRPAFEYIDRLIENGKLKHLRGVLYFTDGYGIYPSARPAYDTAFVFLSEYDEARKVPGWAIRLELSEEQLRRRDEYKES